MNNTSHNRVQHYTKLPIKAVGDRVRTIKGFEGTLIATGGFTDAVVELDDGTRVTAYLPSLKAVD